MRGRGGPGRTRTSNQAVMSAQSSPENPTNMGIFAHVQGHSFTFGCGVLLVIHWLNAAPFSLASGPTKVRRPRTAPEHHWFDQHPLPCPAWLPPPGRGPALVPLRPSPRYIARHRLPHIGLGQAELPGDLRWLDASLRTAFIWPLVGGAAGSGVARRRRLCLPDTRSESTRIGLESTRILLSAPPAEAGRSRATMPVENCSLVRKALTSSQERRS
jgi:hypothetical protein